MGCDARKILLCHAKPCRRAKGFDKLVNALGSADVRVRPVRCQDVCKGPVAGVKVRGKVRWFKSLRDKSWHQQLVSALRAGGVGAALGAREVKKRRGKVR